MTPSPEIAESWETLARSYETMLRALCDTEDPVAMLADWCAGAGLPAPKAASLQDARRAAIEAQWQHPSTAAPDKYALICDVRGEIWLAAYYPDNNGANWRGPNSEVYDDVIAWRPLPEPPLPSPSPGGKS